MISILSLLYLVLGTVWWIGSLFGITHIDPSKPFLVDDQYPQPWDFAGH
jgi:hypothetical protein